MGVEAVREWESRASILFIPKMATAVLMRRSSEKGANLMVRDMDSEPRLGFRL